MDVTLHATVVHVHCDVCDDDQLLTGEGLEPNLEAWADAHLNPRIVFATIADAAGAEIGTWRP